MKTKKAKTWEMISEGLVTVAEIISLQEKNLPIILGMSDSATGSKLIFVQIEQIRGSLYNVINQGNRINPKPYKYLSCAVRRAVKEYKTLLRSGGWKMLTK